MTSGLYTKMQPFTTLLLCLLFIVSSTCSVLALDANKSFHEINEVQKMKMIREYLMKINKPAEKTIKSPDGDLIDCVLFHKQPAFDHPLLKENIPMEMPKRSYGHNSTNTFQLWNANGEECPEGTIPIRRTTEEDILRATSLEKFLMKPTPVRKEKQTAGPEFAMGALGPGLYFGAKADLNVWAPIVDINTEYSLSQIRVSSNDFVVDLNAIEAGWRVSPRNFKDKNPRLFVYWTVDSYKHTGCYNLLCPGFVQTNPKISLGGVVRPVSSYDGSQLRIVLRIRKSINTGDWYLSFGPDNEEIGYWPERLLPQLRDSASFVEFGGEVYNSASHGIHTSTQMGSGHFPGEGYSRAAYIGNIDVIGPGRKSVLLSNFSTFVTDRDCYDAKIGNRKFDPQLGVHIFYGGPGRGFFCP